MSYSYTNHFHNRSQDNAAYAEAARLFPNNDCERAQERICAWPGYQASPLVSLTDVAKAAGVQQIYYKDESGRFGLGSFKALGGSYAIQCLAEQHTGSEPLVVCTATDGNHGRSVAWGAKLLGIQCHIFIHTNVSQARADIMAELGATIHRVNGNYDDSVAACIQQADRLGWHIVSDTSWDGYQEVPRQIMAGYSVMCRELLEQLQGKVPTHIILQAGCGGMAGAVIASLWTHWKDALPTIIVVESDRSDCVYQSLKRKQICLVNITQETLMAGLSCGEVSQLAWPLLQKGVRHVITIDDEGVVPMMRWLAQPPAGTRPALEAGECSASGLVALMAIQGDPALAARTGIDQQSTIVVLGTEGATDPEFYQSILPARR